MAIGYVLVAVEHNKEQDVLESIEDHKEVKEAHILFGEWDIIVKLEAQNPEALGTFVMDNVRSLTGVQATSSLIVAK